MLYAFVLADRPDSAKLRERELSAHRAYLADVSDRMAFAGPLVAEDGLTAVGSLLVIDFPDLASAQAWLAGEPFTRAGVYASSRVTAFRNRWPQRAGFPEPF